MSKIIKPGDRAFYINRNRYAEVESRVRVGVEGFYFGRAIKPGFGVMREFGVRIPNPNLLTDLGMNALGTSPQFQRMHLGTGTAPPDAADTALGNFGTVVSTSNPNVSEFGASGSPPYFGWRRYTWISSVGGATGNWTEIGVSNQNTNGNVRSRSLILDGGGSPSAFPVQSDEQFEGTYEFRLYAPDSDSPATVTFGSNSYDTVTRALGVTGTGTGNGTWTPNLTQSSPIFQPHNDLAAGQAYTGGLNSVTSNDPQGTNLGNITSAGSGSYSAGSFELDSFFRWGSGAGVGAMRTFRLGLRGGRFQVELDPVLNKLTTEEVIHNQRVIWARR